MKMIGNYKIHPVADMFPLIEDRSFEDFMGSILELGQLEPIVVDGDVLIDGRNRLRACLALDKKPRTVEWSTLGQTISQSEWIAGKNIDRRNLTDDQRSVIVVEIHRWEAAEAAAQEKKKAQFKKGNQVNPNGRAGKEPVDTNSYPPAIDSKEKNARSTVGKLADQAKVSHHKAALGIKLAKAVDAGVVDREVQERVKSGETTLAAATKKIPSEKSKPEKTLREKVEIDFIRLMDRYAVTEHAEVKAIIKILAA